MAVGFVLPATELNADWVRRAADWARVRFKDQGPMDICAVAAMIPHYAPVFPDLHVRLYDHGLAEKRYQVLVFMDGAYPPVPPTYADPAYGSCACQVYTMTRWGKVKPVNRLLGPQDYPHLDAHLFNRLSSRDVDFEYCYFPYTYMVRGTGIGPIDELGFRINFDYKTLIGRDASHVVVAVFGGSTTYSVYCLYDDMFTSRLEAKLNAWSAEQGDGRRFTVLNFGNPGNCVLNEISTYLLFAAAVKPDIVIAHDGYNDLTLGMTTDSYLLNHHRITYQEVQEKWAGLLHGTSAALDNQPPEREILNFPDKVIDAYCYRQAQFKAIVQAFGGMYVWGLQAAVDSKAALSPDEKDFVAAYDEEHIYSKVFKAMPLMYSRLVQRLERDKADFVNIHKLFQAYGEESTLFGDPVHTIWQGDECIAQAYADSLINRLQAGQAD